MIATGTALAITGGVIAAKAGLDYYQRRKQGQAQEKADAQARADTQAAQQQRIEAGKQGSDLIEQAGTQASNLLTQAEAKSRQALQAGDTRAAQLWSQRADAARANLNKGFSGAESRLNSSYDAAAGQLDAGYAGAESRLSGLSGLGHYGEDAVKTPLGANFEQDPGYKFRLEQGNQALSRATSAAGGRLSGAALKKLTEYNQGFASNEFGQAAQRDLAIRNMQMHLGDVGYQATSGLANLSERRGSAQSGLSERRGSSLANVDMARGSSLANIDSAEGSYLSGLAANEGAHLANLSTGLGSNLAQIGTNTAAARANSLNNVAAGNAQLTMQGIVPSRYGSVPYAGAGLQAGSNLLGDLGNLAMFGASSGAFGGGGGGYADPYGGADVGRDPSRLNDIYGTAYAPAGYYQ